MTGDLENTGANVYILHEQICQFSLAHGESRHSGPVDALFRYAKTFLSHQALQLTGTDLLTAAATSVNLATLCLYLQGQAQAALRITAQQLDRLKTRRNSESEMLIVQPHINTVRLLRSLGRYDQAQQGLTELSALAGSISATGAREYQSLTSGLSGATTLDSVVEHVLWSERLKCLWGEHKYEECAALAKASEARVATVREFLLRSLIELSRYDEVVDWCYKNPNDASWSSVYAAVALIRGRATRDAHALVRGLTLGSANVQLRLAAEFALACDYENAQRFSLLAVRKANDGSDEVALMLSVALLCSVASSYRPDDPLLSLPGCKAVFYRSLHNPTRVICFAALSKVVGSRARRVVRELVNVVDPELLANAHIARHLKEEVHKPVRGVGRELPGSNFWIRRIALAAASRVARWCEFALDRM
jgi:hypothetical protein